MTDERAVAGVLLAAGDSDRFGERDKLLATLDGEPLVRRAARTLVDAEVGPVAAVVGPESSGVRDVLAGLDLAVVANPDAAAGQATSVRRGVAWARDRADAVAFALGDMPRVDPGTVDRLVAAYRAGRGSALAAGYDGQRGNPVLFDGHHFDALAAVEGDRGGRGVFGSADDAAVVETGDPGVRADVDTPADLAALRE
ncbi:nucleotidyltransferase family protein [Halosimplex marinum]|uniref:nucleotidyltransferase family protein n=1 Tax=Halosimplex marinum TaxID=3396620 RepID=UPI003F562A5E